MGGNKLRAIAQNHTDLSCHINPVEFKKDPGVPKIPNLKGSPPFTTTRHLFAPMASEHTLPSLVILVSSFGCPVTQRGAEVEWWKKRFEDLVPSENAQQWLRYLINQGYSSSSVIVPTLLHLFRYSSLAPAWLLTIDVVGFPNVEKSNLTNSLKLTQLRHTPDPPKIWCLARLDEGTRPTLLDNKLAAVVAQHHQPNNRRADPTAPRPVVAQRDQRKRSLPRLWMFVTQGAAEGDHLKKLFEGVKGEGDAFSFDLLPSENAQQRLRHLRHYTPTLPLLSASSGQLSNCLSTPLRAAALVRLLKAYKSGEAQSVATDNRVIYPGIQVVAHRPNTSSHPGGPQGYRMHLQRGHYRLTPRRNDEPPKIPARPNTPEKTPLPPLRSYELLKLEPKPGCLVLCPWTCQHHSGTQGPFDIRRSRCA
ncbi:hypothetical protein BU15DRAFT_66908 [Melanogaster broomeanus]|nr:hypothetical protein BU15DRAFT_66908 [Melanogaster broomeanus]